MLCIEMFEGKPGHSMEFHGFLFAYGFGEQSRKNFPVIERIEAELELILLLLRSGAHRNL